MSYNPIHCGLKVHSRMHGPNSRVQPHDDYTSTAACYNHTQRLLRHSWSTPASASCHAMSHRHLSHMYTAGTSTPLFPPAQHRRKHRVSSGVGFNTDSMGLLIHGDRLCSLHTPAAATQGGQTDPTPGPRDATAPPDTAGAMMDKDAIRSRIIAQFDDRAAKYDEGG